MLEVYDAAARKSEARQRSAGKGKRKVQISAVERAAWVKKFKESGASSAAVFARQNSFPERTFRDWVKAEKAGGLGTSILPMSRDGTPGKRDRKELHPEVAEKLCQYLEGSKGHEDPLPNLGALLPHVFGASKRLPASILIKKRRYCSISGVHFER